MNCLYESGKPFVTPGAFDLIQKFELNWLQLVMRHRGSDFGDLCVEDQRANIYAIASGARILSSFVVGASGINVVDEPVRLWFITESADEESVRRCTTIPPPGEY